MAELKMVNAIVLRAVNYRDFDRMLTLFTREEGKASACARGAHRPRSPLAAASTQFCSGEYALEDKNGKYYVKSCLLDAAFYPLREDPRRLAYAAAMTQVCDEIVQPGQSAPELYDTLLRALTYLAFDPEHDATQVALPFFLRAMTLSGHAPLLTRCAACGGRIEDARFDVAAGGVVCARHQTAPLPVITREDMMTLRACLQGEFAPAQGDARRLCALAGAFVRARLERDVEALTFAEGLNDSFSDVSQNET